MELVASVMHYVAFNTISHAMLLEPAQTEMRAVDFTDMTRNVTIHPRRS